MKGRRVEGGATLFNDEGGMVVVVSLRVTVERDAPRVDAQLNGKLASTGSIA